MSGECRSCIGGEKRDELRGQEIDVDMDAIFGAAGSGQFKGIAELIAPVIHPKNAAIFPGPDPPATGSFKQTLKTQEVDVNNLVPSSGGNDNITYSSAESVRNGNEKCVGDKNKDIGNDSSHHFSPRMRELLASYGHKI